MFEFEHAGRLAMLRPIAEGGARVSLEANPRWGLFMNRPTSFVLCADLRRATVLPPAVAAQMLQRMREMAPRIERDALLLPPNAAVMKIQMERLTRESGSTTRRICHDVAEVLQWLGEVLTVDERARLTAFLAVPPRAR